MYQHPLIPLVLSIILLMFMIKQSFARHKFLKNRFILSFIIVFVCALLFVFYPEISTSNSWKSTVDWIMLGIDVFIGLLLLIFTELSASKEQFNRDLFATLDETKFYVLVDKKNRVKEISSLFLADLEVEKDKVLRKNIFDVIEIKYRIFSLNGNDATKEDLKIYYNKNNKDKTSKEMNLEIHDDNGDAHAYYFVESSIVVFGKFKGRLFVGDKKSSENLVGMEKNLEESTTELELIKSRFITILDKSKEGVFFTNLNDSSIWVNDNLVESLSLSKNDMSLDEFRTNIHPDDLAMVKAKLAQVNNVSPDYTVSYRYNTGTRYAYVKEEGSRISNGESIELCGLISILDTYQFERTQTELDKIKGEPEMLSTIKQLFQQNKVFQIVHMRIESIPDINEKFGRSIGSMALSEYVKLIKHRYVDSDMIYRISGLEFIAFITDYRKMDMLKNGLVNGEKILHVSAEYGSIDVNIDVSMGISYSSDANSPSMAIANSKEALRFCSNPKFSSNYVYFKDTL